MYNEDMGERYRHVESNDPDDKVPVGAELYRVFYKEVFGFSDQVIERMRKAQLGEEKLTEWEAVRLGIRLNMSLMLRNRDKRKVGTRIGTLFGKLTQEEQEVTKYTVGLGSRVKNTNQIAIITNIHPDKVDTLIASSLNKLKPKEK